MLRKLFTLTICPYAATYSVPITKKKKKEMKMIKTQILQWTTTTTNQQQQQQQQQKRKQYIKTWTWPADPWCIML